MATHEETLAALGKMKMIIQRMEALIRQHQYGKVKIGTAAMDMPTSWNATFLGQYNQGKAALEAELGSLPDFKG